MASKVPTIADELSLPRTDDRVIAQALEQCGLARDSSEFQLEVRRYADLFAEREPRGDLPEQCVFSDAPYAVEWDDEGRPTRWSRASREQLTAMVENDRHIRATGQPIPYVKPAHELAPIPGFVGPLRGPDAAGKVWATVRRASKWIVDQVRAGTRPWRSAEITWHGEGSNFIGVTGPVFRGLALINEPPRLKNQDSSVYAETRFSEPAMVAGSSYCTRYEEHAPMPNMEQILAALNELGGDSDKLAAVAAALGLGGDTTKEPPATEQEPEKKKEEPPAVAQEPPVDKPPSAEPPKFSELSAQLTATQAENALLRQRLDAGDAEKASSVAVTRGERVTEFKERLSASYGPARLETAGPVIDSKVALLPATTNFAERSGKHVDLLSEVFAEVTALMGPAPFTRTPEAVAQPGRTVSTPPRELTVETAKTEILEDERFSEKQRRFLRGPHFTGIVDVMAARRADPSLSLRDAIDGASKRRKAAAEGA